MVGFAPILKFVKSGKLWCLTSFLSFLSFLAIQSAQADSLDSSTWYIPGTFIQSLSVTRHVMDEAVTYGTLQEKKRAQVNEFDVEPEVDVRPTSLAWTLGYTFSNFDTPAGLVTALPNETDHAFHVGLIWEILRDLNASIIARMGTIPSEDYREGEIELNVGNLEFLREKPKSVKESADEEDEFLSNYARLTRRQQRRDEEERRRKNEKVFERPAPRVFEERSLFARGYISWSRHLLLTQGKELMGFHFGPQFFYLPHPTTTFRFTTIVSLYDTPSALFMARLKRPGPRSPFAETMTGYADFTWLMKGLPGFTFAGGVVYDVAGPWLFDVAGSLNLYGNDTVSVAGAASAYRTILPRLTAGVALDLVVTTFTLTTFSLKLSYDL